MKKTIWVFEKSKWYWFVVPNDKKNHNWDYYISEKNFFWAKDWDLVEIEILKTNKGKSKEAKIINILNKGKKRKPWNNNMNLFTSKRLTVLICWCDWLAKMIFCSSKK